MRRKGLSVVRSPFSGNSTDHDQQTERARDPSLAMFSGFWSILSAILPGWAGRLIKPTLSDVI